jgi:methionyl-tRNA synthetase
VTVALSPYLPQAAPRILAALGQPQELGLDGVAYGLTPETDGITAAEPLFPRVEQPTATA